MRTYQVDAVIFALGRVRKGGGILADAVGLGKTIEAGLVIAQLLAEGARRVLLVARRSPCRPVAPGAISALRDRGTGGQPHVGGFDGEGVFLIGREARPPSPISARARPMGLPAGQVALRLDLRGPMPAYAGLDKNRDQAPWAVPDLTPIIGFTDNLGVLAAALAALAVNVTPKVKRRQLLEQFQR